MNDWKLCEVCKPMTIETVEDVNTYVPVVTAFGVLEPFVEEVRCINRY